jgi:hypothetical protein
MAYMAHFGNKLKSDVLIYVAFFVNFEPMTPLHIIEDWYTANKDNLPQTHQLTNHERINDLNSFIEKSLIVLKSNKGNKTFLPYYHRLEKLFISLSSN